MLIAFERGAFARSGEPEATAAAEAHWQLLQASVTKGMSVSFSPKPGAAHPWADMRALLEETLEHTLGPKGKPIAGIAEPRAGGVVDQLLQTTEFHAPAWQAKAGLQAGRLLLKQARAMRDAARPNSTEEGVAVEAHFQQHSKQFDERAVFILEDTYRAAEAVGGGVIAQEIRTDLRAELHKLKPKEYPLAEDSGSQENITPGQLEASKAASLAQAASSLALKVKYLEKAVKLDPQNNRYLELLNQAKAELEAERK